MELLVETYNIILLSFSSSENLIFVTMTSLSLFVISGKYFIIVSLLLHSNKLG